MRHIQDYPNLYEYYDHYIKTQGQAEHDGCFPNLILWIRLALGEEREWDITQLLEMTEEQEEEFGSWGHNSRWAHVVVPMLEQFLLEDDEDLHEWCVGVLMDIAGDYGDPDAEQHYFSKGLTK